MLSSRLRSGNLRIMLLISTALGIVLTIYVLRDTHVKLNEAKQTSEKCQQQQESLSAQLQVVFEHKNRLYKSLEQEKLDHKKSKSDVQAQCERMREIDKHEANNRFNSLQQQHKMLQIQMEDLQEELSKVQRANINLAQEKQHLVDSQAKQVELLKENGIETNNLKTQITECNQKIDDINRQVTEKTHDITDLKLLLNSCEKKNQNQNQNSSTNLTLSTPSTTVKVIGNAEFREKQTTINASTGNTKVKDNVDKNQIKKVAQIESVQNQHVLGVAHDESLVIHDEEKRAVPEEFQGNGLEQQEIGGDQDLDNMEEDEEDDGGEGAAQQQQPPQKEDGKAFDDADFDQLYEAGKPLGIKDSAPLDTAH